LREELFPFVNNLFQRKKLIDSGFLKIYSLKKKSIGKSGKIFRRKREEELQK